MLSCPHCNASINFREIGYEGLFATHRICPNCNQYFDLDARTKGRQVVILVILVLCLVLTILTYVYGGYWTSLAVASYLLFGGVLVYGSKKMYLVKFFRNDSE